MRQGNGVKKMAVVYFPTRTSTIVIMVRPFQRIVYVGRTEVEDDSTVDDWKKGVHVRQDRHVIVVRASVQTLPHLGLVTVILATTILIVHRRPDLWTVREESVHVRVVPPVSPEIPNLRKKMQMQSVLIPPIQHVTCLPNGASLLPRPPLQKD